MAVGKVSLEDWDIFTSSLGCSRGFPASSLPRLAATSLAFMLDWVPEPVCHTTRGKWLSSVPAMISSQARQMASHFSAVIFSGFRAWLAMAAAFFSTPKACMISTGMVSIPTPMGKFVRERWVCAPQYRSAGTCTWPMESCSTRYSMRSLLGFSHFSCVTAYHIFPAKESPCWVSCVIISP